MGGGGWGGMVLVQVGGKDFNSVFLGELQLWVLPLFIGRFRHIWLRRLYFVSIFPGIFFIPIGVPICK